MSRSYKKNNICKDGNKSSKDRKRLASKAVRRYSCSISNGKAYLKIYDSWEINNYISRETELSRRKRFESHLNAYLNGASYCDPREDTSSWVNPNSWGKYYKRK